MFQIFEIIPRCNLIFFLKKQIQNLKTLRDCGVAIELDDKNYKAYLLMGRTMAEMSKSENHTRNINKALLKIEKGDKNY